MSVTTRATKVSFEYAPGLVYSLPFEYQSPSDVKASYIDSVGSEVSLDYNADYTVSGSTVKVTAVLPDGVTITFARQTEITQQTELPPQTITKAIETAIDKNTMCIQEIATDQGTLGAEFNAFTANINQTIVRFEQSFDEFKISINQSIVNLEQNFDEFAQTVNQSITNFEQNFNDFKKEVNQTVADAIAEVEAIKETAITEMNDIKDETQNIANNVNVFIPFVNNGTLSWTNEAGLPNPAPVNIKGEQGSPGKDGVDGTDGTAATITIGTVTTGEPGSNASVTNVGTDTASILDISIPRGDKGDPGEGSGDVRAAGNNTLTGINTFTATNTFDGIIRTKCDYQQSNVMMSSSMKSSLKADDNNVQSYILTLGNGIGVSYWDSSALLAGQVKTFIISVKRDFGGTGSFGIGVNHRIGNNVPTVYMVDGPLPDIAENECLKIAMEVDEPLNAVFIYILGKVAL